MRIARKTRWIVALLLLAIGSQALLFAPGMRSLAVVFWGISFVLLVTALVIAIQRYQSSRKDATK